MPRKPNLLFIFTDQQRRDSLRSYDNDWIQTPNLDALAARSFVFEHAYVTQPVCTPSRASIMTGLWPHTCGCVANNIPLRADTPTIAEMVGLEYRRAYFGKWHLGDEVIPQHGFEEWVSIEDNYRSHYSRPEYLNRFSGYHHYLMSQGFAPDGEKRGARIFSRRFAARLPEEHTKALFLAREAARFLRMTGKRPFLLYVNFLEPHPPYCGPFDRLYDPWHLPVGPTFRRKPPHNASRLHRLMADYYTQGKREGQDLSTEEGWRRLRAQYFGNVTLVDRAVGEILTALAKSGQAENTVIVFTSDHGDMMGDHGILAKTVFYEEATLVPLLIHVPWLCPCRVPGRISQIDLVPTLLELLGVPVPPTLQGQSRAAVLRGEASLANNDVFIEWTGTDGRPEMTFASGITPEEAARIKGLPWRTVISGGWKLNLCAGDQCELYDLTEDPYEEHNRFNDPAQRARVEELSARLYTWQARTGDVAPLPALT